MEKSNNFERMGASREQAKKSSEDEIESYYKEKYLSNEDVKKEDEVFGEKIENSRDENIPEGLLLTGNFCEKNDEEVIRKIHEWYDNAMGRRNREGLEYERFNYHFFEGGSFDQTCMFGDDERGFLLGHIKYGVFVPTHFAPKSIRTGYELMKELGGSDKIPAVMSITPDLVQTISKMQEWHIVDLNFLSSFRGEQVDKMIVHNSNPDVKHLMWGLASEYLNEKEECENYSEEEN